MKVNIQGTITKDGMVVRDGIARMSTLIKTLKAMPSLTNVQVYYDAGGESHCLPAEDLMERYYPTQKGEQPMANNYLNAIRIEAPEHDITINEDDPGVIVLVATIAWPKLEVLLLAADFVVRDGGWEMVDGSDEVYKWAFDPPWHVVLRK